MRLRPWNVFALVLLCGTAAHAGDGKHQAAHVGGIDYHGLPEDAFERATEENKLVFVWRLLGDLNGGC